MYVNKKVNILLFSFILTSLVLLNYLGWFFGIGNFLGEIILFFYISIFVVLSITTFTFDRKQFTVFLFIIILLIVGMISPTPDSDARSYWLYHAKRMYIESSLFAQLDTYPNFDHSDYPSLIPSFITSLTLLINSWNELFPKIGATLTIIPPIIFIFKLLKKPILQITFFFLLVETGRSVLLNGYMDAILAIWLTSSFILWLFYLKLILNGRSITFFFIFLSMNLSILTMIKNEGILMLSLLFLLTITTLIIKRKYNIIFKSLKVFIFPFLIIFSWKFVCYYFNVNNDLMESSLLDKLLVRIYEPDSLLLILKFMSQISYGWIIALSFYLFVVLYSKKISLDVILTLTFVILYVFIIFLIYVSTPHDLQWHLATSATRVLLPITILLGTMTLLKFKIFFRQY